MKESCVFLSVVKKEVLSLFSCLCRIVMIRQGQISQVIDAQQEQGLVRSDEIIRTRLSQVVEIPMFACVITGLRRVGKSTLLRQISQARGYKNVLFLNFDDIHLSSFEKDDFVRLYNEIKERKAKELFFDEIQLVEGWEIFVHQLLREGYLVYVSGSNAAMLSTDLGTHLTGRHIPNELFPFSYQEYLLYFKKERGRATFEEYMLMGGIPEYLKSKEGLVLRTLLDDVLVRDISINKGVRNISALRQLAVYLLSNVSRLYAANKLTSVCGISSPATVLEYISYMKDAYLLDSIGMYDSSVKVTARNPKKVYAYDLGLVNTLSLSKSPDRGHLLENLVFIQLRYRHDTDHIFYYHGNGECDFIVTDADNRAMKAIQVCHQLDDENFSREMNGLTEAMEKLHIAEGYIVTLNEKDVFHTDAGEVKIVRAWEMFE